MVVSSPFGEWLRAQRQAAGLSQQELADRAGISRRAVSDIERGARRAPYHHTVQAIYRAIPPLDDERIEQALAEARKRPSRQNVPVLKLAPLPEKLSGFVDREREIIALSRALCEGGARFVTITGPGGVGKSRLALKVVTDLAHSQSWEAAMVEAGGLAGPTDVIPAISRALGIQPNGESSAATVAASVEGRDLILLLDDFERVSEAGADVLRLVELCARLRVVVTGRGPVLVRGERQFPLEPLPLCPEDTEGDLAKIGSTPAVQLFVMRATEQSPEFRLTRENATSVAEIVRRLDGLPLAIELAAYHVPALSTVELLASLDNSLELLSLGHQDLPGRHRQLRETIAWGYERLPEEPRRLFRLLSVCRGGVDFELAQRMAGETLPSPGRTLEALEMLVRHGLLLVRPVQAGRTRFQMLETVREFALQELEQQEGRDRALAMLGEVLQELADEASDHLGGIDRDAWCDRLEAERENLRAALVWAAICGAPQTGVRLLKTLRDWFSSESPSWALPHAIEMVELGRRDQAEWLGQALLNASWLEWLLSRTKRSLELAREAIPLLREGNDPLALAEALRRFAEITRRDSELESAAAIDESVRLLEEAGDLEGKHRSIMVKALCLVAAGHADEGITILSENAFAQLQLWDIVGACLSGGHAAWSLMTRGEFAKGRETGGMVLARANISHSVRGVPALHLVVARSLIQDGDLRGAAAELSTVIDMGLASGSIRSLPAAMRGAAWLALESNNAGRAARLLGIADRWEKSADMEIGSELQLVTEVKTRLASQLDAGTFELFWREGFELAPQKGPREALQVTRAFAQDPGVSGGEGREATGR